MRLLIAYVDGEQVDVDAADWQDARSDGVDRIELVAPSGARYNLMGHSIYWCREDRGALVLGGGDVTPGPLPEGQVGIEEIRLARGRFYRRVLASMPDVSHSDVKLGWWQ